MEEGIHEGTNFEFSRDRDTFPTKQTWCLEYFISKKREKQSLIKI